MNLLDSMVDAGFPNMNLKFIEDPNNDRLCESQPVWDNPEIIMAVGSECGVIVHTYNPNTANPNVLDVFGDWGLDIGCGFDDGIYRCTINLHSYINRTDCGDEHDCEPVFEQVERLDINPLMIWSPHTPK